MPSLIDAAREFISTFDGYELDRKTSAALKRFTAAVEDAEQQQAKPQRYEGRKRGPTRQNDYAAIRAAVEENEKLPPWDRKSRDQLSQELGVSKPTILKALNELRST